MVDRKVDGSMIELLRCSQESKPEMTRSAAHNTQISIEWLQAPEERTMAEFFYTKAGEQQGPVTRDELGDLIDKEEVGSDDYYWFAGMNEWAVIGDGGLPHPATTPATQPDTTDVFAPVEVTGEPFPATAATDSDSTHIETTNTAPASTAAFNPVAAPAPVGSVFGSGLVTSGTQGDTISVKDLALKMPKPLWLIIPAVLAIFGGVVTGTTIIGLIVAWIPIWLGVILFQANKALESARVFGQRNDIMTAVEKLELYFRINGIFFIITFVLFVVMIASIVTMEAGFLEKLMTL
jgi:hypothetical protein